MYKACIFDLDGTLTDTLESLTYSVNATLREMGLGQITHKQCRSFVGNGARRLLELYCHYLTPLVLEILDPSEPRAGDLIVFSEPASVLG